ILFADLLTELCEKQCLNSIRTQLGSLSLPSIACLASQIVEALTYLRSEFCIHCDIKPENCYVTRDNVVKLGDFGSARHKDDQFIVNYNKVLPYYNGTLSYMSPDALCGTKLTYA
ncbi:MAG: Cyclin-dependent kinase-like 1, partial [Marteilia pararefringens]